MFLIIPFLTLSLVRGCPDHKIGICFWVFCVCFLVDSTGLRFRFVRLLMGMDISCSRSSFLSSYLTILNYIFSLSVNRAFWVLAQR
uniref:Secreted peptide n=1 Tax=Anopheles braziliensis TaxID=58242 RepID=A0A2M3ZLQ5_9DIPT